MNAKCEFECDEEGFVCERCERLIRPACAGLVPGLEFLADTSSEEDLIKSASLTVELTSQMCLSDPLQGLFP